MKLRARIYVKVEKLHKWNDDEKMSTNVELFENWKKWCNIQICEKSPNVMKMKLKLSEIWKKFARTEKIFKKKSVIAVVLRIKTQLKKKKNS